MHSVSDLTTFSRKTAGDVPPKLVVRIIAIRSVLLLPFLISAMQGASTTVVGDKVYLYVGILFHPSSVPSTLDHVGRSSRDRTQNGHRYVCL